MRAMGALGFFLALSSTAVAQDQQLGARTKAMGGSYTAFEDDPVSVWLNPAGIATQLDQASIAYQTYTGYPTQQKRGPADSTEFSVSPETMLADPEVIPSYLGLVFQLGSTEFPVALGFCYARPYLLNYAMDQIIAPSQTNFVPRNEMQESLSRFRACIATDFKFRKPGEGGFLTHVSLGLGADVGYERWSFRTPTGTFTDTSAGLGFGAGMLVGVYDDLKTFKANFGVAYQSAITYRFGFDPTLFPAFDMPQQISLGATFYLLDRMPLRVTFDVQMIDWKKTAEAPLIAGQPSFENVINYSLGFEYRIGVSEKVHLFPRVGYRRFDAPWGDKDDLPATGQYKLVLDTKGGTVNIVTFGIGVSWSSEAGKIRSFDIAADAGGDSVNVALGYTHEF
jgi:hypothetical protein